MVISIPLSVSGDPAVFAAALEAHRGALEAHRSGPAGHPCPVPAQSVLDSLVVRIPASGPVATREPDTFHVVPYQIVDDTPRSAEADLAIRTLRETLA